jgi:opacity protein-like surface antigen
VSFSTPSPRLLLLPLFTVTTILALPASGAAQGFGIGGRMAMIKADVDAESDAVRFTGGQIRLGMSPRTALELSLDRHTTTFENLNERVKETPVQASLLLYLVRSSFSPYVLGGPGWYTRTVEAIENQDALEDQTSRTFGWHAGFGAEIRMGSHAGLHADYRYTHLRFDDDEEEEGGGGGGTHAFVNRLLPSHDGSMWTVGVTIYF